MRTAALARALVLLALCAGGCSFRIARPPPPPSEWPQEGRPPRPQEHCTPSLGPPVLDTAAASLLLGAAYVERDWPSRWPPIILGVSAIPVLLSAIYGYTVAVECRRYQRAYAPAP